MKKYLMSLMVLALCAGYVGATAIGAGGGKKSVGRMNDSSGYPIQFNNDKPWKVFEVANTATAAQVVDEDGVAPKQGMLHKVCVESGTAAGDAFLGQMAIVWDTVTAADMTVVGTGRRIIAPMSRATTAWCLEINALFTSGLGIKNSSAVGSTYVYWRELGGYR